MKFFPIVQASLFIELNLHGQGKKITKPVLVRLVMYTFLILDCLQLSDKIGITRISCISTDHFLFAVTADK
jgi:hypothetical protein